MLLLQSHYRPNRDSLRYQVAFPTSEEADAAATWLDEMGFDKKLDYEVTFNRKFLVWWIEVTVPECDAHRLVILKLRWG